MVHGPSEVLTGQINLDRSRITGSVFFQGFQSHILLKLIQEKTSLLLKIRLSCSDIHYKFYDSNSTSGPLRNLSNRSGPMVGRTIGRLALRAWPRKVRPPSALKQTSQYLGLLAFHDWKYSGWRIYLSTRGLTGITIYRDPNIAI